MNDPDLERAQRAEARWRILRALDAGRPVAISETIIHRTLVDINLQLNPHGLRRELSYLEGKGLIRILQRDEPTWIAELTPEGIDVAEYEVDAPAGIARPKKWWS